MFASDWFISLFTSTMPITKTTRFFPIFFKEGWVIVYKIILMILKSFQQTVLTIRDAGDILVKIKNHELFIQNINAFNQSESEHFWEGIFANID